MPRTKSDSTAQRVAEGLAMAKLDSMLGVSLRRNHVVGVQDGVNATVDGYFEDDARVILVEATAQLGKPKAAQVKKVATDVLKLSFLAGLLRERSGKQVVSKIPYIDSQARDQLHNSGWIAAAARRFGIETVVVEIDTAALAAVREAKKEQDLMARQDTSDQEAD